MTEEKVKFLMRIDSDTDRKIKTAMPLANVRSQNEFVENALRFYCDYLASQDCFSVLPPMLVSAIRATVQSSETHICRILFKLAVEENLMGNLVAAGMDVALDTLRKTRVRCVKEVRETNGEIDMDDALAYQKGV